MDQELTHHGTKGMKWGRRRYQNPDGSLTPAGRKRYGVEGTYRPKGQPSKPTQATKPSAVKPTSKKKVEDDTPEENRYLSKKARSMTDAELDKAITRLKKEKEFKDHSPEEKERAKKALDDMSYRKKSLKEMSNEDIQRALDRAKLESEYRKAYPEKVSAGKKFFNSLKDDVVVPAVKSKGKEFAEKLLGKMIDKYFKEAPDPNSIESLKKQHDQLDYKSKIKDLQDKLAGKKTGDDETAKQLKERLAAEDWLNDNDPEWRAKNPDKASAANKRKAERDAADRAKKDSDEAAARAKKATEEAAEKAGKEAERAENLRKLEAEAERLATIAKTNENLRKIAQEESMSTAKNNINPEVKKVVANKLKGDWNTIWANERVLTNLRKRREEGDR